MTLLIAWTGSAIFSDGSSAVVVGCGQRANERAIYRVHKSASVVIPNTLEYMDWILSKSGMVIGLAKEIPQAIYDHIPTFLQQLLSNTEAYGVDAADMTHAVHPVSDKHGSCSLVERHRRTYVEHIFA